jgi:tetratricopeptide (TPR) repeat protein
MKINLKECLAICESARDIYESLPEPDRQESAHAYTGITYSLNELDRNNEAEVVGKRVIELLKEIDSPDLIRAYRDEAKFAYDAGLYEESIYYLGEVEKCLSVDEHELAIAWDKFGLSRSLIKLKRYEEAISNLKLARETFKKSRN